MRIGADNKVIDLETAEHIAEEDTVPETDSEPLEVLEDDIPDEPEIEDDTPEETEEEPGDEAEEEKEE